MGGPNSYLHPRRRVRFIKTTRQTQGERGIPAVVRMHVAAGGRGRRSDSDIAALLKCDRLRDPRRRARGELPAAAGLGLRGVPRLLMPLFRRDAASYEAGGL